jgi:hypothetical protein
MDENEIKARYLANRFMPILISNARLSRINTCQMARPAAPLGVSASFVVVSASSKMVSESCGYNYGIQTTSRTDFP